MSENIVFYNKGGRPKKFSTPEEAYKAKLDAKKKWRDNNKDRINLYNQLKSQSNIPQQERTIVVMKKSKKHSKRHSKRHSKKHSKKHSKDNDSDSESDDGIKKLRIKKIGKREYKVSFIFKK